MGTTIEDLINENASVEDIEDIKLTIDVVIKQLKEV